VTGFLTSDRLLLEPLRPDHAAEMAPLLADVALHRYIGGTPAGEAELRRRYERQARGRSPDGRERWLNWVVRERSTGRAVGTVQATVEGVDRATVAQVAWVVAVPYQGRGFAREAAARMVEWLVEQGVDAIVAHVHPEHEASMSVARTIGLTPTRTVIDGEVRWERRAQR
jgi:RimJ/RimL family protein N-acetyltransferase